VLAETRSMEVEWRISMYRRHRDAIRRSRCQRSNALLDETPYLTCVLGTDVARCVLLGISTAPFSTGDIPNGCAIPCSDSIAEQNSTF